MLLVFFRFTKRSTGFCFEPLVIQENRKSETVPMQLPQLIRGQFLKRDNRFRATVLVAGQEAQAHVPNSGRLADLLIPNRPVWLSPEAAPHRFVQGLARRQDMCLADELLQLIRPEPVG